MKTPYAKQPAFTIVELLIVIVVIGILATIAAVAYGNIAAGARDAQRLNGIRTIAQALELYYEENGRYPSGVCGSSCPSPKKIDGSWATTSDGSWGVLEAQLVPKYISALPKDPKASLEGPAAINGGLNYDYVTGWVGSGCGTLAGQAYILAYTLESRTQKYEVAGTCPTEGGSTINYAKASEKIVIK
jgi:prepilin-type N-terminal cleavage/methylation domain-containing protein